MTFIKELKEPKKKTEKSYWFVFRNDRLLVGVNNENHFVVPLEKDVSHLGINPASPRTRYLGMYNGNCCYTVEVPDTFDTPADMAFQDLRSMYYQMDEKFFHLLGYAFHSVYWDRTSRYCGRCGHETADSESERAKVCPHCGFVIYPRLSPSMIVAVIKDNKILLASSRRFKTKFYSVLAGFVEPGETLEECVKREVREETGIEVKNIRYFGSQPWPFPDSLMVGFTAEYAGGELHIDMDELEDAAWFDTTNLPTGPSGFSIARRLIDWYIENY